MMKPFSRNLISISSVILGLTVAQAAFAADIDELKSTDDGSKQQIQGVVTAKSHTAEGTVFFVQDKSGAIAVVADDKQDVSVNDLVQVRGIMSKGADQSPFLKLAAMKKAPKPASLPKPAKIDIAKIVDFANVADNLTRLAVVLDVTLKTEGALKAGQAIEATDASGASLKLMVGQDIDGQAAPHSTVHMFGCFMKKGGQVYFVANKLLPSNSAEVQKLATKNTCLTCHQLDKKLVGPSYLDVATKYKEDPAAIAKITEQINNGGMGKWGPVPMIGFKGKLTDAEINELAQWIHDLRWSVILN